MDARPVCYELEELKLCTSVRHKDEDDESVKLMIMYI